MTQWSREKAHDWYGAQPFLIGCNFLPSSASNQLEMFQADSFDVATLRREIGWAADLGFNCLRIYLHDLLIEEDGFFTRLDTVCLLYTSPSPRDQRGSRMPSSA